MRFPVRCTEAVLLALAVLASATVADARAFTVRPPAAWVDPLSPDTAVAESDDSAGIRYLLFDRQIRAGAAQHEAYFRTAWRLETSAGLQDASEVRMSFDPSFQRLVLHHVRVVRGGKTVWSAKPDDVRVTDAEEDAEARLYNDDRTATVFVEGLRVGDSVDYAYTLEGANPVLAGHLDTVLWFEYSRPVDRVRRRICWQGGGSLNLRPHGRAPASRMTRTSEGVVYEWEARAPRAPDWEEGTPVWFLPDARVEVSDFEGWADVAGRARELFATVDAGAPSIDELVQGWGLEGVGVDDRVDRAVGFVQDDVRYLGLEMGPHSHQPHSPGETLERRFGDCKDKAALLVAILRRLGVRAAPALVSTQDRQALDERLPSLFAFDHVIVALEMEDGRHFVDATASGQGGRVRAREAPPFARALVLDGSSGGLVTVPRSSAQNPTTEVLETYVLPDWDSPARLDVVTTYRGADADSVRRSRARSTRADIGRRYRQFYAQEHPGIRSIQPPTVEDDREGNVLVVREAYEIPALWQQGAHEFRAWSVDERLIRPRVLDRSTPFALAYPEYVRHALTISLPEPPGLAPLSESVKNPAFQLDATWSVRGTDAHLEYVYRSLRDAVSPGDVPEFADRVDRAADLVVCRVGRRGPAAATSPGPQAPSPPPVAVSAPPPPRGGLAPIALVSVGALATAFLAWGARAGVAGWRRRRRRSRFVSRTRARAGEDPGHAIKVRTAEAIERAGLSGTCPCGGPWREVDRTTVQYDGQPMTVATRRCLLCSGERALYFIDEGAPLTPRLAGRAGPSDRPAPVDQNPHDS